MAKRVSEELRRKIETLEYYKNGFDHLSGANVHAVNVKVRKHKAIADILLITDAENGTLERYNNCEYPLYLLEKVKLG